VRLLGPRRLSRSRSTCTVCRQTVNRGAASAGFNPAQRHGPPARSESLRAIERFRRRDFGHLAYEITLDDREFTPNSSRSRFLTNFWRTPTCTKPAAKTKRILHLAGNDLAPTRGVVGFSDAAGPPAHARALKDIRVSAHPSHQTLRWRWQRWPAPAPLRPRHLQVDPCAAPQLE